MHLWLGLAYVSRKSKELIWFKSQKMTKFNIHQTAAEKNLVFGHENMGIVEEVGEGVTLLKKGDRIVLPFNVADGRCRNCEEGKTAFCTGVNPGFAGGAYGYVAMGPYQGGQAQYLRVPYADFNALM